MNIEELCYAINESEGWRFSEWDLHQHHVDVPCFTDRLRTNNYFNTEEKIQTLIEAGLETSVRGVMFFSVNECEANYKLWVKVGLSFPGATCTVGRSKNHGDYKCFLVSIPVEPEFASYEECLT